MSTENRKPRVLVVDDDPVNRRMVREALAEDDLIVESARDGVEALEIVRSNPPDLLVLDVMMPRLNGLEVCRMIKAQSNEYFLPIILVTVKSDIDSKVTGLRVGADDYLAKPYNPLELRARIASMLRIKKLQDKINKRKRELEAISTTDELTGLVNHRAMQQRLKEEFRRAQRYNEPLSLLMIDADHFKKVNDQYGHLCGDYVLRELGLVMGECVRDIDVVARYGGEEFMVILPKTHFMGALTVADRIWRSVADHRYRYEGKRLNVTVSVGIAFYPTQDVASVNSLVQLADEALYQAKAEGRNRICIHHNLRYLYQPTGNAGGVQ